MEAGFAIIKMGTFVDSFFLYYENGQMRWESWFDSLGRAQGLYKIYHENGQISEIGKTINDLTIDTVRGYYSNKRLQYLIPYKNGKKDGTVLYFNDRGELTKTELYRNDSLINSK